MKPTLLLLPLAALLAACGADGAPERPPARAETAVAEPQPAVQIGVSGTAEVGVVGSN